MKLLGPRTGALLVLFCSLSIQNNASANTKDGEFQFSVGTGYPFVLIPQVAFKDGEMSYMVNYKIGLDDGFTAGVNFHDNHHIYGIIVGAVGARQAERRCDDNCPIIDFRLADQKSTQGVGLTYEYRFTPQDDSSWALRLEVGYGKESFNDVSRADGNIQLIYHF